jgi:hypothetical protein
MTGNDQKKTLQLLLTRAKQGITLGLVTVDTHDKLEDAVLVASYNKDPKEFYKEYSNFRLAEAKSTKLSSDILLALDTIRKDDPSAAEEIEEYAHYKQGKGGMFTKKEAEDRYKLLYKERTINGIGIKPKAMKYLGLDGKYSPEEIPIVFDLYMKQLIKHNYINNKDLRDKNFTINLNTSGNFVVIRGKNDIQVVPVEKLRLPPGVIKARLKK